MAKGPWVWCDTCGHVIPGMTSDNDRHECDNCRAPMCGTCHVDLGEYCCEQCHDEAQADANYHKGG